MSFDMFAVVGVALVVLLIAVLALTPHGKGASRKNKKDAGLKAPEPEQKDWYAASKKLEHHVLSLRKQVQAAERKCKSLERELLIQTEKYKKLQEKLSLERTWQKKETDEIEKKSNDLIKLKQDFARVEGELEQGHAEKLRLERELKSAEETVNTFKEEKHTLEVELAKARAQNDQSRKEMAELREANAKLAKQHDDRTWIAKSEYVKLEEQLKAKDVELEKLKERLRKEML